MTRASPATAVAAGEEVGSTEEVVKALLEYLVDPLLPLKPSAGAPPPPLSQQQHVAKQLRAVVLLYNYYHRKQQPEAEYLDLVSFSKLVVTLRPALMEYMKSVHGSDSSDLNDLVNELSVTEKGIMDACNVSLSLELLRDLPCIDGWPTSEVAVLLVDSSKENCFLLFSSTTDGVWSLIEKGVDHSSTNPENQVDGKRLNKRKRNSRRQSTSEQNADESGFQHLAFSAVKEVTGIDRSDLMVLERHLTYSLRKEKTSACFYIMQCTQSTNEEFQVPLRDTIESLQAPLVRRSSTGWTITQVIEYYHVLPYAKIMSRWFSRELSPVSLQSLEASTMENTGEKNVSKSTNLDVESAQNSILDLGDIDIQMSSSVENPFQCASNVESNYANSTGEDDSGVKNSKRTNEEVVMAEKSDRSCDMEKSSEEKITDVWKDYLHGSESANVKEIVVNVSGSQMSETLCAQGLKEESVDINVCGSRNEELSGDREANGKSFSCCESCHCANPSSEVNDVSSSQNIDKQFENGEKSDKICKASESRCDNQVSKSSNLSLSPSKSLNVDTQGWEDPLLGLQSANIKEMDVTVDGSKMSETLCSQGLKQKLRDYVTSSQDAEASGDREPNEKSSSCSKTCRGANPSQIEANNVCSSLNVVKEVEGGEKSDRCEVSESRLDNQNSKCNKLCLSVSQNSDAVMDLQSKEKTLIKEIIRDRTASNSIAEEASGVKSCQGTEKDGEKFAECSNVTEHSCEKEITERKTTLSYGVQDSCTESENLKVDDACKKEDLIGMEIDENNYRSLGTENPLGNEASATIMAENREESDDGLPITGLTSKESSGVTSDSSMQKDNTGPIGNCLSLPLGKGTDDSSVTCPSDEDKIMDRKTFRVYHHRKRKSRNSDTKASIGGGNVEMETAQTMKSRGDGCVAEIAKNSSAFISSDPNIVPVTDHALVPIEPSANIDEHHSVLVLKKTELSQAALGVLLQKREKLCQQQREIEDQIASCEKRIQRILDGNEDNLGLKIDTIIDCCSEVLFQDKSPVQDKCHQQTEGHGSIQCLRAKRLSEAVLTGQYACQELDDICCENNWLLPKYVVSVSDGGFLAHVVIKGVDFESSAEGVLCSTPREARESAAAQMITRLRAMTGQTS